MLAGFCKACIHLMMPHETRGWKKNVMTLNLFMY